MKIYKLGNHYLANGDCCDGMFVEEMMKRIGEPKIRCILSDPPYAVAYVESKANFKIGEEGISNKTIIQNDQLQTEDEYAEFTKKWIEPIKEHLDSYNSAYIFNSDLMICALRGGVQSGRILL